MKRNASLIPNKASLDLGLVFVRQVMSFAGCRVILGAAILAACALNSWSWEEPILFTNKIAISNGQKVFSAVLASDNQSTKDVKALIGSQVVFFGHRGPRGTNCVLNLQSNIVLVVEFNAPYVWPESPSGYHLSRDYPSWLFYSSEVMGTLKNAHFENRVITIVARQEDWRVREGW